MMIIVFHKEGKNIQKPIDATLQYDPTKMSLEDMGILSDDVIGNNSDATGTEGDTIELHHARENYTHYWLISTCNYQPDSAQKYYS